jgi:hypothetical protein
MQMQLRETGSSCAFRQKALPRSSSEKRGVERLLGKWHMAAKLEGEPPIVLAQVPFVDEAFWAGAVQTMID